MRWSLCGYCFISWLCYSVQSPVDRPEGWDQTLLWDYCLEHVLFYLTLGHSSWVCITLSLSTKVQKKRTEKKNECRHKNDTWTHSDIRKREGEFYRQLTDREIQMKREWVKRWKHRVVMRRGSKQRQVSIKMDKYLLGSITHYWLWLQGLED